MIEPPIHRSDDLHAAALVWISRRKQIQAMLCREMPHLTSVDIYSIVNGCCLYTSCNNEFFEQIYNDRMAPDEVVA